MSWKVAIFGIYIMAMACSGKDSKIEGVNILSITRMDSTKKATGVKLLKVCTEKDISYPGVDNINKHVIFGIEVDPKAGGFAIEKSLIEYTTEDNTDTECRIFEGDITVYKEGDVITFILQVNDGSPVPILSGSATFTLPAAILEKTDVLSIQTIGKNTKTKDDSLRLVLSKPLVDWEVCDDHRSPTELKCDTFGTTCYAIEIGTIVESSLCIKDMESGAILNTAIFKDIVRVSASEIPNEVLLKYEETALMITSHNINSPNTLEFVPYKDSKKVYAFCSGSETDCALTDYTETDIEIKIIIMSVNENNVATSDIITFKDYKIDGIGLGQHIIELYWERGADDKKIYGAHLLETTRINQDVIIDCSADMDPPPTYCYAYFVGLTKNSGYHATVYPATNSKWPDDGQDFAPNDNNKIQCNPIKTDKASRNQEVTLLDSFSEEGILQVCYKAYVSDNSTNRHELIIIDEGGQWIKIHQSTQGRNQTQCFAPVNLLSSSLEVTKDSKVTAVFVDRELIGNKVLASSQKDINLSAVRAIKPEVDNGSNGSTSTLAIVGAAIGGIACIMAIVAAAIMFVMKIKRDNDGLQYPLHRTNIEQDSSYIHGLDNSIPTM